MKPLPPPPPPRDRSRLRDHLSQFPFLKQAFLWVILIVMFLALSQGFRPDGADDRVLQALAVLGGAVVAVALGLFARSLWLATIYRRAARLAESDRPQAIAGFERVAARWGPLRLAAQLNVGLLKVVEGDPRGALPFLGAVERAHGGVPRVYAQLVADRLAFALALRGELDAAAGWSDQARARKVTPGVAAGKLHLMADAVVAARRGDARRAQDLLDRAWPDLERSTTGEQLRALHVLAAFMASGAAAEAHLAAAGTPRPRELAWLGDGWPELGAFVTRWHGSTAA